MSLPVCLLETFVMVASVGIKKTAIYYKVHPVTIERRIKNLEHNTGQKLFFPYDYSTLTRDGEQLFMQYAKVT